MKRFSPYQFALASLALWTLSHSPVLRAQASPEPQADSSSTASFITAALLLPEAPVPQTPDSAPTSSSSQAPATSQPPAATSPTPESAQTKQQAHDQAERELQAEEKQRLLGVVPQFNVVMGGKALPLSPGQKWRLALHTAIDPFYIGYSFLGGGYSEIVDSHTGFGHGPAGYFKRVGATYADNVNGALIGNALLPVLLHQDPRYFRKGVGTKKSRFVYAALSTVICHGDNGKNQFNISNVAGNFISGAISNAYYPADERGIGLTLENGLQVTAFGAVGGQLLEFAPDVIAHFKKKHAPLTTPATTATP